MPPNPTFGGGIPTRGPAQQLAGEQSRDCYLPAPFIFPGVFAIPAPITTPPIMLREAIPPLRIKMPHKEDLALQRRFPGAPADHSTHPPTHICFQYKPVDQGVRARQ